MKMNSTELGILEGGKKSSDHGKIQDVQKSIQRSRKNPAGARSAKIKESSGSAICETSGSAIGKRNSINIKLRNEEGTQFVQITPVPSSVAGAGFLQL